MKPETLNTPGPVRGERIAGILAPFHQPSLALALAIFLTDLSVCVLSVVGFFLAPTTAWRLVAGAAYGGSMMMLALVAHDSAHLNFSGHPRLDKWLARVAFLPVFHSVSLWIPVHRLHHAQTNLRHQDFTFAPFTKPEYDRLPAWRRLLERFYRHPIGFGPYYFVEVWLKHFVVPRPGQRVPLACVLDSVLVLGFLGAQLTFLVSAAPSLGVPAGEAVLGLFVLPHLLWNYVVGFTVYNQHTLETVPWHVRREEWNFVRAQLTGALHIRWPALVDLLFHRAMNHTAHHLDARVPPYRLARAQAFLEERFPELIQPVDWTWKDFLETTRRCKLYDYEHHRWLDFEGRPTTPTCAADAPVSAPAAAPGRPA